MIALYSRVSTEEQARNGYSIQAQKDELERFAKENHLNYQHYCDEGFSGGTLKRPALQRLLEDVKKNKVNLIVFVKLDRWFRSVPQYYKIQEILEEHHCNWRALQEDYETETSSGKFKVNIMLSVSQQFKDATSERIKSVFKYKKANGYKVNTSVPVGFATERVREGIIIKVANKEMIQDFFMAVDKFNSMPQARSLINDKYNIDLSSRQATTLLHSTLTYGDYNGVQVLEPIISKKEFNRINSQIGRKKRVSKYHYDYIFKSLIRCPNCDHIMIGRTTHPNTNHVQHRYFCRIQHVEHKCDYNHTISEKTLETWLLSNIKPLVEEYIYKVKKEAIKPLNKNKSIEQKLRRLNDMYLEGKCSKSYFDSRYAELQSQLVEEPKETKQLEQLIQGDFFELYNQMSNTDKNFLWRHLIKAIYPTEDGYKIVWY